MSNLQLIKAETFNNLPCNFYRNMNDDILLTREQIGQALEYTDPMVAIGKIHNRHSDRLDQFSFTNLVNGHQTYYYTEKGVMEICRWSKSKRANEFMDWVWDIVEKYRHNEFPDLPQITSALALVTNTLTSLTQLESAYTLDVIEHNLTLRKAYENIVDTLLNKYNLSDGNYETRYTTIFDDILT